MLGLRFDYVVVRHLREVSSASTVLGLPVKQIPLGVRFDSAASQFSGSCRQPLLTAASNAADTIWYGVELLRDPPGRCRIRGGYRCVELQMAPTAARFDSDIFRHQESDISRC